MKWTNEEVEILKQHYDKAFTQELLIILPNRTINQIRDKAHCLKIKRKKKHIQDYKKMFWRKVQIKTKNECWLWKFSKLKGYGTFWCFNKRIRAHRMAYILKYGNIPNDLLVLHTCDNRSCCNPFHLELGTHEDNMKHMKDRSRAAKGSDNGNSKLTQKQVQQIRNRYNENKIDLAKEYDVSFTTIYKIINNKTRYDDNYKVHNLWATNRKLTKEQVLEIRQSNEKQSVLAKKFNVDSAIISNCRLNKTYKDIME